MAPLVVAKGTWEALLPRERALPLLEAPQFVAQVLRARVSDLRWN